MHTESGHPGSIWRTNLAYYLALAGRFDEVDECLAELALVMRSDQRKLAQWEYRNTLSEIAVVRGDFAAALQLAQAALEYAQRHAFPTLESQSWVQIGLCEVKLGQYAAARQHVLRGLPGLNEVWYTLYALYGEAAVAAAQQQPERAVELAALVYQLRAIGHHVKVFAGELLAELEATLPPDVYAAAVARGAQLDPDEVVAAFLQEENS